MSEIVNIAINLDRFWEFAGIYYKLGAESPIILIDREQSVGGYNNSELTLSIVKDYIISNDKNFQALVNETITANSKIELNPASANGYTSTNKEREILKLDNKNNLSSIISKLSNDTGKYVNPNINDMPELYISKKEHEEIVL